MSHPAEAALEKLREGNQRYVDGESRIDPRTRPDRRRELVAGQTPFAIVLGCSDSRVPVEVIFDQGLGDLFVVRVAGNVAAPSGIGSIEFAVENFGSRLVVVLGHAHCGAVAATLAQVHQPSGGASPNLLSIVDRIRPGIEAVAETDATPDEQLAAAVTANVQFAVGNLRAGSDYLDDMCASGELRIVGAEYALETGRVTFLPAPG